MGNAYSNYKIIDVTPTISTAEYASGDALFNKAEIPNAVLGKGGCAELINITVNCKKAAAAEAQMNIILMQSDQSMEAANEAMNITAVEGTAANFLGTVDIATASCLDMGNYVIGMPSSEDISKTSTLPFLIQADSGSTSVFFTVIILGAYTFAANDFTFRFHIKQR